MTDRHYRLRGRNDRHGKKARCACGWESPLRITPPTGRRRRDARARYRLIKDDFEQHLRDVGA